MRASKIQGGMSKEKVLVNNEPDSPHHKSDGVHKDKCNYISTHALFQVKALFAFLILKGDS
jgi:hypothetical protein